MTTVETELINETEPIRSMYKLGNKFQALASGLIPGQGTAASDGDGTMSGGYYELSTVSSGIHKIATDPSIPPYGSRVSAINLTSGTTSYFLASSGGTIQLNATGANVAILEPGDKIDVYRVGATAWTMINATADITGVQINT